LRALIQRVSEASVTVQGEVVGEINRGLVILLGISDEDSSDDAGFLAEKCANLRIFADNDGRFDRSCLDIMGETLVISQFTLYGDTRKGRRPNFMRAAAPEISKPLYELFISNLRELGLKVESGIFGAMMTVRIHNDGPVTLMVESRK
jgi:D-tyrosyl-tRNA(Tyr) deacylase